MEEIVSVPFKKVERSYFSTPTGWRLATFEEARNGLEIIKERNILGRWDRVRLLDGWILGSGYDYKMGNDFNGCLGYMLLIQTEVRITGRCAYDDVHISDSQKEVALFLCADDCNYELLYWLFNSWAKTHSYNMDLQDVAGGRIPFRGAQKFVEMNRKVCSLARKLGDQGPVSAHQKAANVRFTGEDSVKHVLSHMINIANAEHPEQYSNDRLPFSVAEIMEECFGVSLEPDSWLENCAKQGGAEWINIADTFWNFLSECFAGWVVEISVSHVLANILCEQNNECDLNTITSSQENFMVASLILFSLSFWRREIIHAPLAHRCSWSTTCAGEILRYVTSNSRAGDLQRFKQRLENNAMWRCYDHDIGNYELLNKLLVLASSGRQASYNLDMQEKTSIFVVQRLLDCGAQPGPAYALLDFNKLTALLAAIRYIRSGDIEEEIIKSLLDKCDEKQQEQLLNAPKEDGWTALHLASRNNKANICEMLLHFGAKLDVAEKAGRTPLHIAVEEKYDRVVNVFIEYQGITELVDLNDENGKSPLDRAVDDENEEIVAMLLFESKQPEAYFDRVNLERLLRCSLLNGFVYAVRNLFERGTKLPAGECDDEGKTVLHLAAMCEDNNEAMEMVDMMASKIIEVKVESLVGKQDKRGRTALHEAALNGNKELCEYLLKINPKIIDLKDRDGRTSMYDAIAGEYNERDVVMIFLRVLNVNRDSPLNSLADRNGLTPLHVAVSLGKKDVVELLVSQVKEASEYVKRSDFLGQTALHKATNSGDLDIVKLLLKGGAHPLEERDCDGRTALHYAVKAKGDRIELTKLLLEKCKSNEEKWLLLWASAAGLGTADSTLSNDDSTLRNDDRLVHKFLLDERDKTKEHLAAGKSLKTGNLLKAAAVTGDIEMTKELIARGYQMADLHDTEWREGLSVKEKYNVNGVLKQLERIAQQANDQPTILDNLGRIDYAHGLAALLLNPYIKPPIVVGISGSWGTGKSSLMAQTETILLKTVAQVALLPSSKTSSTASELPDISTSELSTKGKKKYEEIKRYVNFEQNGNKGLPSSMIGKIWRWVKNISKMESQHEIAHAKQDSLEEFLSSYKAKYRKLFKSLAAMDSKEMFTIRIRKDQEGQVSHSKSLWGMVRDMFMTKCQLSKPNSQTSRIDSPLEESVPAILTVNYNAWKYKNETEALAGMAVQITKELEGIMSEAQWLSTCWRNTWKKKKYNIWIEIIYPCLLAIVLACTITWILWALLDKSDKLKHWVIPKYACLPTGIIIIGWTVTKSAMGILKPVSTQLMSYVSFPDHTDKLGYQERVISDINFLKEEIGKRPCRVFSAYSWISTMISILWVLIFECWFTRLLFNPKIIGKMASIPEITPASGSNLGIIVFIDDLDRCQESVILQVLSAINLVLAVCEISVVLGIDKGMIERSIIKKYGDSKTNRSIKDDQELADKYLQKIIQLPLDLPDPSEDQSKKFLEGQLGIFKESSETVDSKLENGSSESADSKLESNTEGGHSRKSTSLDIKRGDTGLEIVSECSTVLNSTRMATTTTRYNTNKIYHCLKQLLCKLSPSSLYGRKNKAESMLHGAAGSLISQTRSEAPVPKDTINKTSNKNYWSWIPLKELLFVRYSKGEQDAFCYFQKLSTNSRKFPREWKCFLNYHRLVWYIFYLTGEAKDLAGWQVQFIAWIFVCWEWQENMNFIIQNWNEVGVLRTKESNQPSLYMIVDHFIELEENKYMKKIEASIEKVDANEVVPKGKDINDKTNQIESSKAKQNISEKNSEKKVLEVNVDQLEKILRDELDEWKQEIKDDMNKWKREIKDELKKEIKDLKDQVIKQNNMKNTKREEEKKIKLKQWKRMKSALYQYDVTMDGILAFQRFRFYCIAGHLSWHLSEHESN